MAYIITHNDAAILCGHCGHISHNPNDVAERYCGACKQFHEQPLEDPARTAIIRAIATSNTQFFNVLATWVRRGDSLHDISQRLDTQYGFPPETLYYEAAMLTVEWLIGQREIAAARVANRVTGA